MKITVNEDGNIWSFTKNELKVLMSFCAPAGTVAPMKSLYLDADGGAAVTTDGHRLLALYPETRPRKERGVGVYRSYIDTALRACTSKLCVLVRPTQAYADVSVVEQSGAEVYKVRAPLMDTPIPWQEVMPPARGAGELGESVVHVSPRYLADVASIGSICHGGIRMELNGASEPIRFTAQGDGCQIIGLVAPMRG
jgi:hypothetical protein